MLAKQDFIDQIWSSSRRRRRPRHAGQSKIHCPNLKQQKKKKKKAPTCWPIQNSLPKFETEEEEEEGPDMLANQKFIDQIWSSKRRRRRFELLFWLKKNIRYALKKDWMQTDARNKKNKRAFSLRKNFMLSSEKLVVAAFLHHTQERKERVCVTELSEFHTGSLQFKNAMVKYP